MVANWYALFLSIVTDTSPDKALGLILGRSHENKKGHKKVRKRIPKSFSYIDDPLKLIELKKTYTYGEIAKMYGTYKNKIYENIRHYKQSVAI